jgi:hypothetical protein
MNNFSTCSILQAKVQVMPHGNFSVLRPSIAIEWDPLAAEYIRKAFRMFHRAAKLSLIKMKFILNTYMVSQQPNTQQLVLFRPNISFNKT